MRLCLQLISIPYHNVIFYNLAWVQWKKICCCFLDLPLNLSLKKGVRIILFSDTYSHIGKSFFPTARQSKCMYNLTEEFLWLCMFYILCNITCIFILRRITCKLFELVSNTFVYVFIQWNMFNSNTWSLLLSHKTKLVNGHTDQVI